jgi:DNA-binding SARP family transcriptional activator
MAIVHLRLLGEVNFNDATGQAINLRVKKVMALFAYLAIQQDDVFSRSQLAQLFWPNSSEKHARQSLRQALADLRKRLPDFGQIFEISHAKVSVNRKKLDVDVVNFLDASRIHDFVSQEAAYGLYDGRFLDNLTIRSEPFSLWKEETSSQLHERFIHVVEFLAEHNLLEGKTEKAIALNQQLVQLDPIRESAHRCLISLYASRGQVREAEEQYLNCSKILEEKLASSPEERTIRAYQRIQKESEHELTENDSTANLILHINAGREKELLKVASLLKAYNKDKQGQALLVYGDRGTGKSWLLKQSCKIASNLDFNIAYSRFFNIKFSHENGVRDALVEIINPDPATPYDQYPTIIANRFFRGSDKRNIYLAILYIIFDLPLARRLERGYSTLRPDNREHLHTKVIVDIFHQCAIKDNYILVFDDIDLALPRALSILKSLLKLTSNDPIFLILSCNQTELVDELKNLAPNVVQLSLEPPAISDLKNLFPLKTGKHTSNLIYLQWANRLEKSGCFNYDSNLNSVLNASIEKLAAIDQLALQACVVLGMRFSYDALSSLIDNPHYHPEQLIAAGFLVQNRQVLEFSHIAIQQCLYKQLDRSTRRQLHARAANYYLFGNSHLHAYHLEASDSRDASKAYLTAAGAANDEFRLDIAVYLYEKSYECAHDKQEQFQAMIQKGNMLLGAMHITDAIQTFQKAQHLSGNKQQQAQAWLGMGFGLVHRKHYLAAKALLDRCESIMTKNSYSGSDNAFKPDHGMLVQYYYYRAIVAEKTDSEEVALRYNKIALEHAKQYQSSFWLATLTLQAGNIAMMMLRINEANEYLNSVIRLTRENNHGYLELSAILSSARVHHLQGDFSGCVKMLEYIMGVATLVEDKKIMVDILSALCLIDLFKGQFNRLLHHAELSIELCTALPSPHNLILMSSYRLFALYQLNRHQEMKEQISNIQSILHRKPLKQSQTPLSSSLQAWNLAPVMAFIDDCSDDAAEYLNNSMKLILNLTGPDKLTCCFLAIEAAIKHGLWEQAENLADEIIMDLNKEPLHLYIMCAERVRILSSIAHGQINHTTRPELVDILTSAKSYGMALHIPAYEQALEQLRHGKETT